MVTSVQAMVERVAKAARTENIAELNVLVYSTERDFSRFNKAGTMESFNRSARQFLSEIRLRLPKIKLAEIAFSSEDFEKWCAGSALEKSDQTPANWAADQSQDWRLSLKIGSSQLNPDGISHQSDGYIGWAAVHIKRDDSDE